MTKFLFSMYLKCAICAVTLPLNSHHILCDACRVQCGGFKK